MEIAENGSHEVRVFNLVDPTNGISQGDLMVHAHNSYFYLPFRQRSVMQK